MNDRIRIQKISTSILLMASCAFMFGHAVFALPEDAKQEISIEGGTSELNFDQEIYIIREDANGLAHIKQGSMEIFGSEIRLEMVDGVLNKAIATGTPARFQQQPAADQAVVYITGLTLDYDNGTRTLNIDGDASYSQAGNTLNGLHIDYNLDTRQVNAAAGENEKVKIVIPAPQSETP